MSASPVSVDHRIFDAILFTLGRVQADFPQDFYAYNGRKNLFLAVDLANIRDQNERVAYRLDRQGMPPFAMHVRGVSQLRLISSKYSPSTTEHYWKMRT